MLLRKKRKDYVISEREKKTMSCEFQHCKGYIVEHSEGATCLECNRVQSAIMQEPSFLPPAEETDDEGTIEEFVFLVDRHIISAECSNHAQRLFKKVREMKINYNHIDLVAIVVCQSVFDIYGSVISLPQLCALLQSNIGEKSFLRKFAFLSKRLPEYFKIPETRCAPLALSYLGLNPRQMFHIEKQSKYLVDVSDFQFSYGAALYQTLLIECPKEEDDVLRYVCGYPLDFDVKKCIEFIQGHPSLSRVIQVPSLHLTKSSSSWRKS